MSTLSGVHRLLLFQLKMTDDTHGVLSQLDRHGPQSAAVLETNWELVAWTRHSHRDAAFVSVARENHVEGQEVR
jgi:hypothetical protein